MSKPKKNHKKEEANSPVRDLAAFLLLAVSVFFLIVLLSYHPTDPSWNTGVDPDHAFIQNYGGILGSYFADLVVQLFGYAAYAIPVALLAVTWAIIFRPVWSGVWPRIFGFLVLVISSSLLFALVAGDLPRDIPWGGGTGYLLRGFLVRYLGLVGAYLLGLAAFATAWVLTAGLTFSAFLKLMALLMLIPALVARGAVWMFSLVRSGIGRFLELGENEIEKGMKQIRRKSEPAIPKEKIKIAGAELDKQPPVKDVRPLAPVIPITLPQKAAPLKPAMPKFHSMLEAEEAEAQESKKKKVHSYRLPDADLLEAPENQELSIDRNELFQNAQILEQKLKDFGVFGNVVEVQPGPVVTMYEFEPAPGVKVHQLTRLNDDLALALKALSVRIEPIPGKSVIGIEVANRNRQVVYLKDGIAHEGFASNHSRLTLALGKDISGAPVISDLRKMPHLLVAGATGSGKSVAVNSMILSILYKSTPDDVRMILVDPKMLELSFYEDIPHLLLPVVTDPRKSAAALRWAVMEMERRYRLMADIGVRNIEGYNKKVPKFLKDQGGKKEVQEEELPLDGAPSGQKKEEHTGTIPYLVIVIDELADLMMVSSREVEESIIRLAQMARAAGIHLMLATQRPSVDVITGVIKANMPARISFQVSSKTDSRTILDANGAELLLGAGDMLFLPPGTSKLQRIHGAFVTDSEVKRVTDFWKEQAAPDYQHDILKMQEEQMQLSAEGGEDEEMYQQALSVVRSYRVASISMIQRKLRIGYNRAARLVERMEEEGLLAPGEVGKPREVIMSRIDGTV